MFSLSNQSTRVEAKPRNSSRKQSNEVNVNPEIHEQPVDTSNQHVKLRQQPTSVFYVSTEGQGHVNLAF